MLAIITVMIVVMVVMTKTRWWDQSVLALVPNILSVPVDVRIALFWNGSNAQTVLKYISSFLHFVLLKGTYLQGSSPFRNHPRRKSKIPLNMHILQVSLSVELKGFSWLLPYMARNDKAFSFEKQIFFFFFILLPTWRKKTSLVWL